MSRPYRPSNGSEGMDFIARFCRHCKRDARFRETQDGRGGCPIVAATFCYPTTDPKYPKEWIEDDDGARCTAFEAIDG
jgi:hypothetical protein